MTRRWFGLLFFSVCSFAIVTACGGGESRPGPLEHRFENMHIAHLPQEDQQDVFRAQTEFNKAQAARAKANADYEQATTDLDVARNEAKAAILEEDSANSQKKAAEKRGNMNEVNQKNLVAIAAKMSRQAADKKVKYMEARRKYRKDFLNYTEDQMYAAEARYELTKARLAQQKNIRPKDFSLEKYQQQDEARARYVQKTRGAIERKKSEVERLKSEWKQMEGQARKSKDEAGGGASAGDVDDVGGDVQ